MSLTHNFAKLVTKVMANRLAPFLNLLVAANQSAFIRGRCIHDNFILVQQNIKLLHRTKTLTLFLKLDISKEFDSISRAFLLEILSHLGFGPVWCNLIRNLLETSSTRVLVNGEPGSEIRHQRGLRQGDPLFTMLFILVMDVLNSLFTKAGEVGLLAPLVRRSPLQRISLYADNVTLFIRPTEQEMNLTIEILSKFGEASGLQTNLQKSCVVPIRCEEAELDTVTTILPCPTSSFPCKYLGLPVSNSRLRKADLLLWIEKIGNKLPGWKVALMNMAGRVTWVHCSFSSTNLCSHRHQCP